MYVRVGYASPGRDLIRVPSKRYVDAVLVEDVTGSNSHHDLTPMRGMDAIRVYETIYSYPRRIASGLNVSA
jgi:hypothetical protein